MRSTVPPPEPCGDSGYFPAAGAAVGPLFIKLSLGYPTQDEALAVIRGRDYLIPDDVEELAVPVLAHRIIMRGISYLPDSTTFYGVLSVYALVQLLTRYCYGDRAEAFAVMAELLEKCPGAAGRRKCPRFPLRRFAAFPARLYRKG